MLDWVVRIISIPKLSTNIFKIILDSVNKLENFEKIRNILKIIFYAVCGYFAGVGFFKLFLEPLLNFIYK
jgi:hypothetical protein